MTPTTNVLDESALLIQEIENNLEKSLLKRREEITRELQERIRREQEESERQLTELEGEVARERETLKDYRGAISEFETSRDSLHTDIKDHLDRSLAYQKDIERLTALTLDELRELADLTARLTELRDRTELKVSEIRTRLKDKYGVVTEPLDTRETNDIVVNLEQELFKLKRIKALLESEDESADRPSVLTGNAVPAPRPEPEELRIPVPDAEPEPLVTFVPPESSVPESVDAETPRADFKMPEINQFIEEFVKRESERLGDEPFGEPVHPKREEKKPAAEEFSFQTVFEMLEKNRKSEPTDYNGEISFFQNGDTTILDGETMIRAMNHIVDDSRKLYLKLGHTESPKDQFFLKQDLINHQEILRKIILRGVKLCDRENSRLPRYTEDVLNLGVLKEVLDKLNLDNWSNEEEFRAFEAMTARIKDAFYKKITPPALYLKSIVQELET